MKQECSKEMEHRRNIETVKTVASNEKALHATHIFHLLSDLGRLKIVLALMQGSLCVYHLTEVCGGSQSAVSHQLRTLREGKIVSAKRVGKTVEYSLADEHIREIVALCLQHTQCGEGVL